MIDEKTQKLKIDLEKEKLLKEKTQKDKKEQEKSPFGPVPIVFYASKEILPVPYFCLIASFLCPSCSSSVQKFYFFKAGSCGKFRWQYDYC